MGGPLSTTRLSADRRVSGLPLYVVLALIFVATADMLPRLPDGSRGLTVLTVIGLGFGAMLVAPLNPSKPVFLRPARTLPAAWVGFLLWAVLLCLLHPPDLGGVQNLLVYVAFFGGIWVTARRCTPATPDLVLKWLLRGAWVLATLSATQTAIGGFNAEGELLGRRSFGLVALFAIAAICSYWTTLPARHRWLGLVLVVEIAASGSRMSLALAAMVAAGSVLARKPQPSRLLLRGLLAAAGFVALAANWAPLRDRFIGGDSGLTIGGLTLNSEGRGRIWAALVRLVNENPWGLGFGQAEAHVEDITRSAIAQPHNDYLRLLVDTGWLGLGLWVLGALMMIRWLLRLIVQDEERRPLHVTALLGFAAMLGQMVTDNPIIYIFVVVPAAALLGTSLAFTGRGLGGHAEVAERGGGRRRLDAVLRAGHGAVGEGALQHTVHVDGDGAARESH